MKTESVIAQRIVVILDRPAHPGNIGAAALAMGNMGLSRLRLICPRQFPHEDAKQFAVGYHPLLEKAEIFSDVQSAVADLNFLVATSNRSRGQRHTVLTPRQLAQELPKILAWPGTEVGLLFGTERTGLETIDLERAHVVCNIPTTGLSGSLNLGQSVLVVAYEIMLGMDMGQTFAFDPAREGERAGAADMERLFEHLWEALTTIGFLKFEQNRHMMGSLKALFHRASLDRREVAILRGILNEVVCFRQRQQKKVDM